MATYDTDEVQKVVFTKSPEGGCPGGQCGPPPDVHQVPIGEPPPSDGGDQGEGQGEGQGEDQIFQEAQDIVDAMQQPDGPVSCGSIEASEDKQEELDMLDSINADEAIQKIEDEVAEKGDGDHPFTPKAPPSSPGTGAGGGDYEIALEEVKRMPRWVKLIKEFAEKDFEKVRGKKELDAPFSFAYGFVQRGKVRAPDFRKHMYIMADVSGSMMGGVVGKGNTLVEKLLSFIPKLTEDYTAELWFVSSGLLKRKDTGEDAIYTPRELMDMDHKEFAKWLQKVAKEQVQMGGGTSFAGPFNQMLEERKKSDDEGIVVVLTDTDFNVKPIPKNTILVTDAGNKRGLESKYKKELADPDLHFHIIDFEEDKVD